MIAVERRNISFLQWLGTGSNNHTPQQAHAREELANTTGTPRFLWFSFAFKREKENEVGWGYGDWRGSGRSWRKRMSIIKVYCVKFSKKNE